MLSMKKGIVADFVLMSDEGTEVHLNDLLSRNGLVLYFYPKDDSPMCSLEALEFANKFEQFKLLGFNVVGISSDSFRSHKIFKTRYNIPFTLLSDVNHAVMEDYGVWVKKKLFGREYNGVQRSTFLIVNGSIVQSWVVAGVRGHANVVLEAARAYA